MPGRASRDLFEGVDPTQKMWMLPAAPPAEVPAPQATHWLFFGAVGAGFALLAGIAAMVAVLARPSGDSPAAASDAGSSPSPTPASASVPAAGQSPASAPPGPSPSASPSPPGETPAGAGTAAAPGSPAPTTPAGGARSATPAPQTTSDPGGQAPQPTTAVPTTAVPTTAVPTTAVPTTAVPMTAAPPVLSGNRTVATAVASNPGGHPCALGSPLVLNFFITRAGPPEPGTPVTIAVSGAGLPSMGGSTVIGPSFGSQGGSASASGSGAYCGFTTTYRIDFTISPGSVSGTITIGGDGALPGGQAIVFSFSGGGPG